MPDVQTVPALPWPTGDGGGIIKLSRRVTEQDLIDGILKITLDNAGREYNASIVRYQDNTLRVVADNDVFTIDPIPQTSDTLTLTRIAGEAAQAYSLINVELATERLAEIFKNYDLTEKPQVGDTASILYIKINKQMMAGDGVSFNLSGSKFQKLVLQADATPPPSGAQFSIRLYDAFTPLNAVSEGYSGVIRLDARTGAQTLQSPLVTEFGWL